MTIPVPRLIVVVALTLALLLTTPPAHAAPPELDCSYLNDGEFDTPSGFSRTVAREIFGAAGRDDVAASCVPGVVREARHAVLATNRSFADALAASSLLGDGPLIFPQDPDGTLSNAELNALDDALPDGGTVYLAGGTSALGPRIESALTDAGFSPHRLSGPSRYETAIAIAEETRRLYPRRRGIFVARADNYADAIAVGPYAARFGIPIVLSGPDTLHPATSQYLEAVRHDLSQTSGSRTDTLGGSRTVLLGGHAALSDDVEAAIRALGMPAVRRVEGQNRYVTAQRIQFVLWKSIFPAGRSEFILADLEDPDRWQHALALSAYGVAMLGYRTTGDTITLPNETGVVLDDQVCAPGRPSRWLFHTADNLGNHNNDQAGRDQQLAELVYERLSSNNCTERQPFEVDVPAVLRQVTDIVPDTPAPGERVEITGLTIDLFHTAGTQLLYELADRFPSERNDWLRAACVIDVLAESDPADYGHPAWAGMVDLMNEDTFWDDVAEDLTDEVIEKVAEGVAGVATSGTSITPPARQLTEEAISRIVEEVLPAIWPEIYDVIDLGFLIDADVRRNTLLAINGDGVGDSGYYPPNDNDAHQHAVPCSDYTRQ